VLYGSGIAVSSLAGWLSRGADSSDPPGGGGASEEPPSPEPAAGDGFDWDALERQFSRRERDREPVA
jgi:hypothetical protein